MFDVVIYDGVGQPYAGDTVSGIGGSEHFVIKLARALAGHGLHVLVRNNLHLPAHVTSDGVCYENRNATMEVECKTLILQRYSTLPINIAFDRLVVQVHDIPDGDKIANLAVFFQRLGATLVCNSEWQRSLFPSEWKSVIIPPMLHALPEPQIDKDRTGFIYASAAMKGFDETLNKWRAFRKLYSSQLKEARLYVISSGYDTPKVIDDPSIIYLGALNDAELWAYLNRCAGMFYVNTYAETFGVTAAIAECFGTRTHIMCLGGFGALKETLSDQRFLTDDHDHFRQNFLETYGSHIKQTTTKDYRPQTTLSRWLDVLKASK